MPGAVFHSLPLFPSLLSGKHQELDKIECLHHTENILFTSLGLEGLQSELQKLIMP